MTEMHLVRVISDVDPPSILGPEGRGVAGTKNETSTCTRRYQVQGRLHHTNLGSSMKK